ncbi:Hypothetical predicted protein [Cloeon dipterum]|uniref:GH18 domain-containing protein n=2 Tax=Cloeon dipterum TaxID=197152 RepID=A0A8S1CGT4_9INSE|nr:Hypothetical predicted protein [Cloeon dipterum]
MNLYWLVLTVLLQNCSAKRLICYYGSWNAYREGSNEFSIENVPVKLCTHVIYSFLGLGYDGSVEILDPSVDEELDGFNKTLALKKLNKNLKVMIAIGGGSFDQSIFADLISDPELINTTINSIVEFLTVYPFDGVDLDWEFPGEDDRANLVTFVTALKKRFSKMKPKRLLTAAVTADPEVAALGYDMKKLIKSLDWVHVMSYDFHSYEDGETGLNAQLYNKTAGSSVDATVKYWKKNGVPVAKLVVGIPLYAKSYTLTDSSAHGLGDSVDGAGSTGTISESEGKLNFLEYCSYFDATSGWITVDNSSLQASYAYKDDQWISFDSYNNYIAKAKYAKKLGGAMVWEIGGDDYNGLYCKKGKYPVLTLLFKNL